VTGVSQAEPAASQIQTARWPLFGMAVYLPQSHLSPVETVLDGIALWEGDGVQLRGMCRIRLRTVLPVFHTLIDLLLLLACLRIAYIDSREAKEPFAWLQHYDNDPSVMSVAFDAYTPEPLAAIFAGTLPISLVTTLVFPRWLRSFPFDLRWVGLHLVLGITFWYTVGRLGETTKAWRIGLVSFLLFRAITVPLSLSLSRRQSDGEVLQYIVFLAYWLAAVTFGLWTTIAAVRRKRSRDRQDVATEA
jgi:hypothetical protein